MSRDVNAAQVRAYRLVDVLAGYEITGRRLIDIAADMGSDESKVLRDLYSAQAAGWAEQGEDKLWRLAPRPIQIALRFQLAVQREQERVEEFRQRYTRTPA